MREILFKAKRLDNGEWVEGFLFEYSEVGTCIGTEPLSANDYGEIYRDCYSVIDPETVCQDTGLTDVNNDKVFEGDKLAFTAFDYNDTDTQYDGVVVCDGSRFVIWKSRDDEYYGADGGFDLDWVVAQDDEIEVRGNIHD